MDYELSPSDLKYFLSLQWELKFWTPTAALIDKKSGSSHLYTGQSYDPVYFQLAEQGWNHDHCEICSVVFCKEPHNCETEGYEAENNWICKLCFNKCLAPLLKAD